MPLVTSPKAQSATSNTPSKVITRQEVAMGRSSPSTARVDALKAKLTQKTPTQPVAPRPARTSARQEEIAKLNKYTTSTQNVVNSSQSKSQSRQPVQDLSSIAPPPSGLVHQDNIVEASPAPTEAPGKPLDAQTAALVRQQQQLRKAQLKLKAEQEAWKQEQAKYLPKERLTSETLKVLAEAGVTPDKLAELQIAQASANDPLQVALNRIQELEQKIQGITDPENGTLAQRDKAAYDQAVKQIRNDAELLVESNPDFEAIKSEGKLDDVVELVTRVFDEEGIILDVEEAATLVEDKLTERITKQYERIGKLNKFKSKFGKQAENPAEASPAQQQQPKINTLTNKGATSRPLTPKERAILRVQEAMDLRKGK